MAEPEEQSTETSEASDASVEEIFGGSEHFSIGDGPPGENSVDSDEAQPAEAESGVGTRENQVSETAPEATSEAWFTFKTADGTEKVFSSADEAQQFFGSWNGRLSKAQRELSEAEQYNLQWQRAYEDGSLFAEYQKQRGEEKPAAAEKEQQDAGVLGAVDWKYVNRLLREGKSDKALQYLSFENGEYLSKTLKKEIEQAREAIKAEISGELEAPTRFYNEAMGAAKYVAESAQAAVNDMGQPLFPEFQDGPNYDPNFTKHFRDIWMQQDYQLAFDPNLTGVRAAYYEAKATYRPPVQQPPKAEAQGDGQPQQSGWLRPSSTETPPRGPDGKFIRKTQALAMSDSEGAAPNMSGQPKSREQQILEGMRNAGTRSNKHFGVAYE